MKLPFVTALAAAFVVGVAAAALSLSAAAADRDTVRPTAPRPSQLRVVSAVELDGSPSSMVAAAGSLWVTLGMAGIARIDPATNTVVARIEPGGAVSGLAAGFGAVWAIDAFHDRLLRIDPDTNRVTRETRVGGLPSGIAIGHGSVWVGNQLESTVTRIDPDNGRTLTTFAFQDGAIWPGAITTTADAVWVITRDGNAVSRINPSTSTVDRLIPLRGARSLTVANGSVWAGVANSTSLFRVGPRGLSRVTTPYRSNAYGPELAGGDALWLAVPAGVARVSPAGVRMPLRPRPLHLSSIVTAAGDVWVADQDGDRVLRLTDVGVTPR